MSGSPCSNDLTKDDCDQNTFGVPSSGCPPPNCLKPAEVCPTPMPMDPNRNQGRQGSNQGRQGSNQGRPVNVSAILNAARQIASAPPAHASSSSIGSTLSSLATSRIIASKEISKDITLPLSGAEAESNVVEVIFPRSELAQKLGGNFNGVKLTPERAILSGLHIEVDNDSQYGVVIDIPDFVNADSHSIGNGLSEAQSGACIVAAGRSRKENLLADEAVIQDQSVSSLETFSAKQLEDCEHTNTRGKWNVYAKMQVAPKQFIVNPVLKTMYEAAVIDQDLYNAIESMNVSDEVHNIDQSTYNKYKMQLIDHAHTISSRLTDLTNIKLYIKRSDGLNFNKEPEFIQKMRGSHAAEAKEKFNNVPGHVHVRMWFEYASDSVSQ